MAPTFSANWSAYTPKQLEIYAYSRQRTSPQHRVHRKGSVYSVTLLTVNQRKQWRSERFPFSYDAAINGESTSSNSLPAFNEFDFLPQCRGIRLFAQENNYSLTWEPDEMNASGNLQRDAPDMCMRKARPALQTSPIVKNDSSGLSHQKNHTGSPLGG